MDGNAFIDADGCKDGSSGGASSRVACAHWRRLARAQARRVNLGWLSLHLVPLAAFGGMGLALGLLPARQWMLLPGWLGLAAFPLWLLLAAVISILRARRHFIGEVQALARLDASCHLHNRLSAAMQGVGDWPPPPDPPPPRPRWNPARTLLPLLASLAALLLAAFLPLKAATPVAEPPPLRELSAWTAVDASLELLREQEAVEQEALEKVDAQLDALRAQPRENWYRPGSMEASDHLREQVGQAARDLQQALNTAATALATAASTQLAAHERDALLEQLGQALDALQQGMLPLDAATLAALKEMACQDGMKSIDPAALKQLLEQLREQGECLGECASFCRTPGSGNPADGKQGNALGEGQASLASAESGDDASGGVSRDNAGNTPMSFRPPQAPLQAGNPEALANRDLRQAALGDTTGVSTDQHAVDREAWTGVQAGGGAAAHAGQGGEAVWRLPVMPHERTLLKAYFE